VRYGGNTTCIEIRTDNNELIILDAGTGIFPLSQTLLTELPVQANVLITHSHWDHIQGLPFFIPNFIPGNLLRLHGAFDGILGLEALEGFDLELDLPRGTLTFYRARICPGGAPPWSGPVSGIRRLPAGDSTANRPFVPARLNGQLAHALLDTGATDTVVDTALARAAGAPATPPPGAEVSTMITITDPEVVIWRHGFAVLEVACARLRAPRLWIAPLGEQPNIVVGQDILSGLRIWLSPGSGTVHIAPAALRPPGG
jgi:hypothetical protein